MDDMMKRKLTWKSIFITILGAALLAVVAGLVLALAVGHVTRPNSDLIVKVLQPVPFDLYTHCGINELRSNGRYFQRVGGVLVAGSRTPSGLGNPPSGWGNPYQHGTLTITGDIAVFRDKAGHVETFKVRSGATGFLNMCD
jgi:hypothetical protein